MHFRKPDRLPFMPDMMQQETLHNWHEQGLPYIWDVTPSSLNMELPHYAVINYFPVLHAMDYDKYFGFERTEMIYIDEGPIPRHLPKILEKSDRHIKVRGKGGITQHFFRRRASTKPYMMPQYLDWPVKTLEDWEKLKTRYDPADPRRYPVEWGDDLIEYYENVDHPVGLGMGGFYSCGRELMGSVNFCTAFYKDPELVHELLDYHAEFLVELLKPAVEALKSNIDWVMWHEDLAHRHGPNISPKIFREFMLPNYKKVSSFFRHNGIDVIIMDTDGDFRRLIPLFIDGGVNGSSPLEVGPFGLNAVELRKKYLKYLLRGNIDKRAIVKGKDAIEKEIESKVPYLKEAGGYIPNIDHYPSPDTPLENYMYYLKYLKKFL